MTRTCPIVFASRSKGHQVETASYRGWSGVKNGDLLKLAEADGVQILLTGDKNLIYQQSMVGRQIAIIVLSAQDFAILSSIQAVVDRAAPGSFQSIDCGALSRS